MTRDEVRKAIEACARGGVVRAVDLRARGVTDKEVVVARRAGDLERHLPGTYLVRGVPLDDLTRGILALKYAGPESVLTGLFAAGLMRLPWIPASDLVQVLVGPERRRAPGVAWLSVRRDKRVLDFPPLLVQGLPMAPLPHVVADAARVLPNLRDVRGVVLGALSTNRCTVDELLAVLDAGAVGGTALARRACRDAERGAASPPEAELGDALAGCGRPFYLNCEIWLDGVLLGVADAWLLGAGTGGEIDSREWHGSAELLDATLARHKRFELAGLSLEHRTPQRFRQAPQAFVTELLEEADRRQRQGLGEPSGLELRPRGPLLF